MDKRSFIRVGIAGSAAGLFIPKAALAAGMDKVIQSKLAGGLYYTEHAFGRWNKQQFSYAPKNCSPQGLVDSS